MKKRVAIVGGSCVDIFATSALPLVAHDSNPGTVNIGFGGVGRNIAENLARLNQDVLLISAFGNDPLSTQMQLHTNSAGVNTRHSFFSLDSPAPYYISVNDTNGDMSVAVNDMKICDLITPEFLAGKLEILNQCDAIVLDTNIPRESIDYLALHCTPPLFAEAVSTRKAVKLASALPHLFAVKTNRQEAETLLGTPVTDKLGSLKDAADKFHELGIPYLLITLGVKGSFLSCKASQLMMNAFRVRTVNANGCGDAFSAAAFLGILSDDTPKAILENALAAAAITAMSAQAVSEDISMTAVDAFLHEARNES